MSNEEAQLESEFPREIEPSRDLWAGIEKAITEDSHRSSRSWSVNTKIFAASAASVLVAVLAIQLMPSQTIATSQAGISALVNTYEEQKGMLLAQYKDQPAVTNNWQQQLNELEAAAVTIRASLKDNPDNAVLTKMLSKLYQQQLDLINKVHSPKWQQI